MKSVMSHNFSMIPRTEINRSTFNRSHGLKTTLNAGYLVPIECQEVLPGDDVSFDCQFLGRMCPLVAPLMDNIFLDTHWFFVPSRLVWTNFIKMMGERTAPNDSIDFTVPTINSTRTSVPADPTVDRDGFKVGSLADYLGIPVNVPNLEVNALPFRAYQKIWDDWFRDENLQDSVLKTINYIGDNGDVGDITTLRKRGKRHDYFTSCLPWTQKGNPVTLPFSGAANVIWDGGFNACYQNPDHPVHGGDIAFLRMWKEGSTTNKAMAGVDKTQPSGGPRVINFNDYTGGLQDVGWVGLLADLSSATAITVNSLRMAFQLQRMLEKDARGGTRYVEIIRNHFATICPDARLQRSEYLGGSSELVNCTPIAATTNSDMTQYPESGFTPQGWLTSIPRVSSRVKFKKAFTEHGYLIGLASIRADLNYQQGLNRLWSRRTRYDFFWPTLQNVGEQAVLNKEIYAQGSNVKIPSTDLVADDQPFGYQERYAEYRYAPSMITGLMRSCAKPFGDEGFFPSLDVYHLAQKFGSLPALNGNFIVEDPPLNRVKSFTVMDGVTFPDLILDAYLGQTWTRPMSTYSIPGLVDHL